MQVTRPSFLETKIEDKFYVLKSKNETEKSRFLKKEIDYIFDLKSDDYQKLMNFSRKIALALKRSINCKRIALSIIGLEVPHVHVHLIPIQSMSDMNFNQKINLSDDEFKLIVKKIKSNLK